MYLGEAEKSLRRTFEEAAKGTMGVSTNKFSGLIFFDEIDALGRSRGDEGGRSSGGGEGGGARRVLNELLLLLTEYAGGSMASASSGGGKVLVLAATNRPEDLDPALLRRFQARIHCPLPGPKERLSLAHAALAGLESEIPVQDLQWASEEATSGWSASDLRNLYAEVAMGPVREAVTEWSRGLNNGDGGGNLGVEGKARGEVVKEADEEGHEEMFGWAGTLPSYPYSPLTSKSLSSPIILRPIDSADLQRALHTTRPSRELSLPCEESHTKSSLTSSWGPSRPSSAGGLRHSRESGVLLSLRDSPPVGRVTAAYSTGSGGGLSTSQTCTCICSGCTGYSPDVKQSGFQEALNALLAEG